MRPWRSAAPAPSRSPARSSTWTRFVPGAERSVEDKLAAEERVRRSAEALRALKPDEAKALMLKAHGLSYEEIGARCGWSYTKVNRSITEGRRRFLSAVRGDRIGSGVRAVRADRRGARQPVGERCPSTPDPPPSAPLHRLPRGGPRAPSLPAPPRVAVLAGVCHRRAARQAADAQARRRSTLPPRPGLRPGDGSRSGRFRRRRPHRHRGSSASGFASAAQASGRSASSPIAYRSSAPTHRRAKPPEPSSRSPRSRSGPSRPATACASSGDGRGAPAIAAEHDRTQGLAKPGEGKAAESEAVRRPLKQARVSGGRATRVRLRAAGARPGAGRHLDSVAAESNNPHLNRRKATHQPSGGTQTGSSSQKFSPAEQEFSP